MGLEKSKMRNLLFSMQTLSPKCKKYVSQTEWIKEFLNEQLDKITFCDCDICT